jgi:hypothetical protein
LIRGEARQVQHVLVSFVLPQQLPGYFRLTLRSRKGDSHMQTTELIDARPHRVAELGEIIDLHVGQIPECFINAVAL